MSNSKTKFGKFCSLFFIWVVVFGTIPTTLAKSEVTGMYFYGDEDPIATVPATIISFMDDPFRAKFGLADGSEIELGIDTKILDHQTAAEFLSVGQSVEIAYTDHTLKTLRLTSPDLPTAPQIGEDLNPVWISLIILVCVLGVWKKFYERALKK